MLTKKQREDSALELRHASHFDIFDVNLNKAMKDGAESLEEHNELEFWTEKWDSYYKEKLASGDLSPIEMGHWGSIKAFMDALRGNREMPPEKEDAI